MTLRTDTVALFQANGQNLVLLEAQILALQPQLVIFGARPDRDVKGSEYAMLRELRNRLVDAVRQNRTLHERLLAKLDPFDDAYDFSPPIPVEITPFGLVERITGFSSYLDPTPQIVAANVVSTMVNTSDTTIDGQKPADVETFYDGEKFVAGDGDAMFYRVTFTCQPTNFAAIASHINIWIDYGAGVRLFEQILPLDGYGIAQPMTYQVSLYAGPTFEANGGFLRIQPDGDVTISNISYLVTRLHKGRSS